MKIIAMGDSLMQFNDYSTFPQTGWVQVLDRFMNDPKKVRVCDYALNGRSTKSFIDEGQYQKALDDVEKGDVVLVSFGHNDEKHQDPSRYCPAFTTYQENLTRFYNEITAKGGIVIFLSSIERLKYEDGKLTYSHLDYPKAMEEVSKKLGAYYIDLNKLTHDFYSKYNFEDNKKYVMTFPSNTYENYPEGKEDTTHLTMLGAMNVCKLVVPYLSKIKELSLVFKQLVS